MVEGLSTHVVQTPEMALELIAFGETTRHVGRTDMNEKSSRSHTILQVVVESTPVGSKSDALQQLMRPRFLGQKDAQANIMKKIPKN